eukprot:TRINITY_DN91_c0_g1_i20.p1 TRINITY_DN91_c0_g1~~TRINITY_DN91_c0_g1_i20.p1  ORF type:complete len:1390 (-),score=341.99 TRINITY_DN91_c0_g1_i20:407-4576(-)
MSKTTLYRWEELLGYGALFVHAQNFNDPNLVCTMVHYDEGTVVREKVDGVVVSYLYKDYTCKTLPLGICYVESSDSKVIADAVLSQLDKVCEACKVMGLPSDNVKKSVVFTMHDSADASVDKFLEEDLVNLAAGINCLKHAEANCLESKVHALFLMEPPGLKLLSRVLSNYSKEEEAISVVFCRVVARLFSCGVNGTDSTSHGVRFLDFLADLRSEETKWQRRLFAYNGNRWGDKIDHAERMLDILEPLRLYLKSLVSNENLEGLANFEERHESISFKNYSVFALLLCLLETYKDDLIRQLLSFSVWKDLFAEPLSILLSNNQNSIQYRKSRITVIKAFEAQMRFFLPQTENFIPITTAYEEYAEDDFSTLPLIALLGDDRKPFASLKFQKHMDMLEEGSTDEFCKVVAIMVHAGLYGAYDKEKGTADGKGAMHYYAQFAGVPQLVSLLTSDQISLLDHLPVDNYSGEALLGSCSSEMTRTNNVKRLLAIGAHQCAKAVSPDILNLIAIRDDFIGECRLLQKNLESKYGTYSAQRTEHMRKLVLHRENVKTGRHTKENRERDRKFEEDNFMKQILPSSDNCNAVDSMTGQRLRMIIRKVRNMIACGMLDSNPSLREKALMKTRRLNDLVPTLRNNVREMLADKISLYDNQEEEYHAFPRDILGTVDRNQASIGFESPSVDGNFVNNLFEENVCGDDDHLSVHDSGNMGDECQQQDHESACLLSDCVGVLFDEEDHSPYNEHEFRASGISLASPLQEPQDCRNAERNAEWTPRKEVFVETRGKVLTRSQEKMRQALAISPEVVPINNVINSSNERKRKSKRDGISPVAKKHDIIDVSIEDNRLSGEEVAVGFEQRFQELIRGDKLSVGEISTIWEIAHEAICGKKPVFDILLSEGIGRLETIPLNEIVDLNLFTSPVFDECYQHFVCIFFDVENRLIVADSLRSDENAAEMPLNSQFSHLLAMMCKNFNNGNDELKVHYAQCLNQQNGKDCGVWSFLFAEMVLHCRVNGITIPSFNCSFDPDFVLNNRKRMVQMLHYKRYVKPPITSPFLNGSKMSLFDAQMAIPIRNCCKVARLHVSAECNNNNNFHKALVQYLSNPSRCVECGNDFNVLISESATIPMEDIDSLPVQFVNAITIDKSFLHGVVVNCLVQMVLKAQKAENVHWFDLGVFEGAGSLDSIIPRFDSNTCPEDSLRIIPLSNHYYVCFVLGGRLVIADSSINKRIHKDKVLDIQSSHTLAYMYGRMFDDNILKVSFLNCCQQDGDGDCGVFALLNYEVILQSLMKGLTLPDLCSLKVDINDIRKRYQCMIQTKEYFPMDLEVVGELQFMDRELNIDLSLCCQLSKIPFVVEDHHRNVFNHKILEYLRDENRCRDCSSKKWVEGNDSISVNEE